MSKKETKHVEDILPLAPGQKLFMGSESKSHESSIHVYGYRLTGDVDSLVVKDVWDKIVAAFPSLRTSLHVLPHGRAFQVVHSEVDEVPYAFEDLRHLPRSERDEVVKAYQEKDSKKLFDWHVPPLARVALHRLDDRESVMTITIDHLIFDGWSLGLAIHAFLDGCETLSKGEPWNPPVAPSMRDYIEWHGRQDTAGALAWFRNHLDGLHAQRIPFAKSGDWPDDICADKSHFLSLTEEENLRLQEGAKRAGVTLYVLLQGAWSLILSHCQEEYRAFFIATIASRPAAVHAVDSTFGLMLGIMPHNYSCGKDETVGQWLDMIRAYQVEAMNYHYVEPHDIITLYESLAPFARPTCMVFQNMDTGTENDTQKSQGITVSPGGVVSRSNYPLVLAAQPVPTLLLSFMYDDRIVYGQDVEKLAQLLKRLMLALTEDRGGTLSDVCSKGRIGVMMDEVRAASRL